jgi:hypothetical protein
LNIQSNDQLTNARVSIVSASGITVLERNLGNGQAWVLSTSHLKKGIYVLRISSPDQNFTGKLIIE